MSLPNVPERQANLQQSPHDEQINKVQETQARAWPSRSLCGRLVCRSGSPNPGANGLGTHAGQPARLSDRVSPQPGRFRQAGVPVGVFACLAIGKIVFFPHGASRERSVPFVLAPLASCCLTSAYDPYRAPSIAVYHNKKALPRRNTQRYEPVLPGGAMSGIVSRSGIRITKDGGCLRERHPVLTQVCLRLANIPIEANAHAPSPAVSYLPRNASRAPPNSARASRRTSCSVGRHPASKSRRYLSASTSATTARVCGHLYRS